MKNQSRQDLKKGTLTCLPKPRLLWGAQRRQKRQSVNMDGHTLPVFSYKCTAKAKGLACLRSAAKTEALLTVHFHVLN